jgi:hypothetical protein
MFNWFRKKKDATRKEAATGPTLTLDEIRAQLRRRAIRMNLGGIRPPESPLASWFGKVLVALPGENWPAGEKGQPMHAICQINLTELPFRPTLLQDTAFLSVFIDPESHYDRGGVPNGTCWLLRAYKTLEHLRPVQIPEAHFAIKPLPLTPEIIEQDYPCHDNVPWEILDWFNNHGEKYYDHFSTTNGLKLGGWPSLVQSELYWEYNQLPSQPDFTFQIDSEEKAGWYWGDAGVVYFGRGMAPGQEDTWSIDAQCY